MQERKPNKIFFGVLLFSILLCISASAAEESVVNSTNSISLFHPISDHVPRFTGPYATQGTTPGAMTLPPTPTPTFETTMAIPSPRVSSSLNERFVLFAGGSTLIKFLQNSSHFSQDSVQQSTIITPVTTQIPDSTPVIPVYSSNPIQNQKRFSTTLPKIQVPASQPFVINTRTPLLPSNPITQDSNNFDEIVDAYMRNLTAAQKKLLSTSLLALTDPAFPVDRQADTIRGTYGALVTTGVLIPADQLGPDKSVGDIIRVVIGMNQGYSTNSVDPYLYDMIISDKQTNSVVAWVPLQNINKIAELEAVKYIDCPIAAINY